MADIEVWRIRMQRYSAVSFVTNSVLQILYCKTALWKTKQDTAKMDGKMRQYLSLYFKSLSIQ
jgi:hypothetical protein